MESPLSPPFGHVCIHYFVNESNFRVGNHGYSYSTCGSKFEIAEICNVFKLVLCPHTYAISLQRFKKIRMRLQYCKTPWF